MATRKVFCIGFNSRGEFGLGHKDPVTQLTQLGNKLITRAFTFQGHCIFANNDYSKLWAAGINNSGQLGIGKSEDLDANEEICEYTPITYFEDNKITIKEICGNAGVADQLSHVDV